MNLPKNLEEKRDELAREFNSKEYGSKIDFKKGFNSALYLLLPEIEKLEETLEWYATKGEGAYTDAKLYLKAENTLQSLREFLGSEAENE